MKLAAESIRTLVTEKQELEKQAEVKIIARSVIDKMVDGNMLAAEEVLPKLAELETRDTQDLLVLEKAIELGVTGNVSKLAELSDKKEPAGQTASEIFLQEAVGDLI
jgi:hypothetical protein